MDFGIDLSIEFACILHPEKLGKVIKLKILTRGFASYPSILKNFDRQIASSFKFTVVNIEAYEEHMKICSCINSFFITHTLEKVNLN